VVFLHEDPAIGLLVEEAAAATADAVQGINVEMFNVPCTASTDCKKTPMVAIFVHVLTFQLNYQPVTVNHHRMIKLRFNYRPILPLIQEEQLKHVVESAATRIVVMDTLKIDLVVTFVCVVRVANH